MIDPLKTNISTESVLTQELEKFKKLLLKNDAAGCIKTVRKLNNILENKPKKYFMYKNLL